MRSRLLLCHFKKMTRKVTEEDVPPIAELFKERLHHFELLEEIIEKYDKHFECNEDGGQVVDFRRLIEANDTDEEDKGNERDERDQDGSDGQSDYEGYDDDSNDEDSTAHMFLHGYNPCNALRKRNIPLDILIDFSIPLKRIRTIDADVDR